MGNQKVMGSEEGTGVDNRRGTRPASEVVAEALVEAQVATAAELARRSALGVSTVGKALAGLEAAGVAVREAGGRQGGRRLPDRWSPPPLAAPSTERVVAAVVEAGGVEAGGVEAGGVEAGGVEAGGVGRLGRNQLRDLVLEALSAQSAPVGPAGLARETGRSAGAIGNCLERLVGLRLAVRVGERPRRYRRAAEPTTQAAG